MMMQYSLIDGIKLGKAELEKIAQIDNEIPEKWDPYFSQQKDTLEKSIKFFTNLSNEDFFKVVYEEDQIIGFHVVRAQSPINASIYTLWVRKDKRKSGIAKQLKEAGIRWEKEKDFLFIQTSVSVENKRMLKINRESGFEDFTVGMRMKL